MCKLDAGTAIIELVILKSTQDSRRMQRPFLKWAGSKYSIIERINAALPSPTEDQRLVEPFVGSGAVFLNAGYARALVADVNADLIALYKQLKEEGEEFIAYCEEFFAPRNNSKERFYELRDQFNKTSDPRLRSALFVYLNRHCYNGLCRYNAKGEFNVPYGQYKKPYFPKNEMRAFAEKSASTDFLHASFEETFALVEEGDVVYCDPPYVPLTPTASFTSYAAEGFDLQEQRRLAELAREAAERGATVILSNHDTELTRELYHGADITSFGVQRFISSKGDQRGKAPELIAVFKPRRLATKRAA